MSKNTLLNYFTRSPVVNKRENGVSSLNKENEKNESKTVKRQKTEDKSSQIKSENTSPLASKTAKKDASKLEANSKTPNSSKKRARKVSLRNFNSPSSHKKDEGKLFRTS